MTATTSQDPFAAFHQLGDSDDWSEFDAIPAPAPVVEPVIRCLGCGRELKSETSRRVGLGRTCLRNARRRATLLDGSFTDAQIEAAVEAIEDGAVVPAAVPGIWYVVGSKGDEIYETTAATCTCKAFTEAGRLCWHRASVALIAA